MRIAKSKVRAASNVDREIPVFSDQLGLLHVVYPGGPFRKQIVTKFYAVQKRRSVDPEALKWWNVRSGSSGHKADQLMCREKPSNSYNTYIHVRSSQSGSVSTAAAAALSWRELNAVQIAWMVSLFGIGAQRGARKGERKRICTLNNFTVDKIISSYIATVFQGI